jgi:hypothetical protein
MKNRLTALVALAALVFLASPQSADACAACYGASDSPLAKGMNMGLLFLLGVIGSVLLAITAFFIFVARNSARLQAAAQAQIQTDKSS